MKLIITKIKKCDMDLKLIDRILALGNLIGHAGLAYIEADVNLQVSSWNQGAKDLFGYTENEAVGSFLNDLIPVKRAELINCKGDTKLVTSSHVNNQGKQIQCDIYYSSIINTKGDDLGVAVLAKDISATLKDKADLLQQEQSLKDIFGFAPIGIYNVNMEGKMLSANSEYAWMLGYESTNAIINQVSDFVTQVFFDHGDAEKFMTDIYDMEQVRRFRCRLKRRNNSFIWALCYAKATHDSFGRVNGFNGFSIDISETVRTEEKLKKLNEKLKMLSVMDGLTQIPNRRKFDEHLKTEWKRHYRNKRELSVILCDIDFFKLYNDNYGHQAGDDCLVKVARAIHSSVTRPFDLAARYGGEEFVIVLPETSGDGAMGIAEKIRKTILRLKVEHEKSTVGDYITLSLGVATMVPLYDLSEGVIVAMADKALYRAKENGRNQSLCGV